MTANGQIIRHADHVEAVRSRFAPVHDASASIAAGEDAYGRLCRWIVENFRAKHVRQDELVAYLEENLRLIGEQLCGFAGVETAVHFAADPGLVAPVTVRAVPRVGWTMEDIAPLREVLDQLTGRPDVIAAHARTWHNIAAEQWEMAEELEDFVEYDTPDWQGADADEHRRLMDNNVEAIKGLASVSAALGEVTESVGVLVAQTRRLVRDLVVDLITLPVSGPEWTFARWARRIAVYGVALDATLTHLENRLNG